MDDGRSEILKGGFKVWLTPLKCFTRHDNNRWLKSGRNE